MLRVHEAENDERREARAREAAEHAETLAFFREAREGAIKDAITAARARFEADLLAARRLASEHADRWQCAHATQLLRWHSHELVVARSFRLFCNAVGQVGNGFDRALSLAETSVRDVPPPPLAIRGVSVKIALVEGSCKAESAPDVLAALHALARRHVTLRLEASPHWQPVHLPTLNTFDLDGGGIVPWSPPGSFEEIMRRDRSSWALLVDTGTFRVPASVHFTVRVALHGEELPSPLSCSPGIEALGTAERKAEEDERNLRRMVREIIAETLSDRPL